MNKTHSQRIAVSGVHGTTSSLRSMGNLSVHFTDNPKVKPVTLPAMLQEESSLNLLGINLLTRLGSSVFFNDSSHSSPDRIVFKDGAIVPLVRRGDGLYVVNVRQTLPCAPQTQNLIERTSVLEALAMSSSLDKACSFMASTREAHKPGHISLSLAHQRMCHIAPLSLVKAVRRGIVTGVRIQGLPKRSDHALVSELPVCSSCRANKLARHALDTAGPLEPVGHSMWCT